MGSGVKSAGISETPPETEIANRAPDPSLQRRVLKEKTGTPWKSRGGDVSGVLGLRSPSVLGILRDEQTKT